MDNSKVWLIEQARREKTDISISNWSQIGPIFRHFERPPKRRKRNENGAYLR